MPTYSLLSAALVLLLTATFASADSAAPGQRTLVRAGQLVDVERGRVLAMSTSDSAT